MVLRAVFDARHVTRVITLPYWFATIVVFIMFIIMMILVKDEQGILMRNDLEDYLVLNTENRPRTPCACLCGLKFKPHAQDTCHDHLQNWEIWTYRRKQMHDYLARKLRREPGDLAMNSGDLRNILREEKLLMHYATIENRFDKYRGNPAFWQLPVSLRSREAPYKGSEYFKVKSYEERNEIPDVTYVRVPDAIWEEKGMGPRTRDLNKFWQNSTYRQTRVLQVAEKLHEIQPHKPDLSGLIILGSAAPSNLQKNDETTEAVQEDQAASSETKARRSRGSRHSHRKSQLKSESQESQVMDQLTVKRFRLRINGHEFTEFSEYPFRENKITVMFEHFVDSRMPCMQTLLLENNGQTALRIYWNKYDKVKIFREYTASTEIFHPFKFDRNEIVLLPGEKREFQILFQVNHPGNFIEHWQITTSPEIWKDDFKLLVLLKGFCFVRNFELRAKELQAKLQEMMRNSAIKGILNQVIKAGNYCVPKKASNSLKYSEQELFESANWVKSKTSSISKYVYSALVVDELKGFYELNKFPEDDPDWDFSIKKLREIARKRDLIAYFEEKVNLYETAKVKREALKEFNLDSSRNKATSGKKEDQKKATKGQKEVVELTITTPTEDTCYIQLTKILNKLERPTIYPNKQRKKYMHCYTVMKTYFCQMFDSLDNLPKQDNFITNIPLPKTPLVIIDRLTFENFDESYILRTKRLPAPSHIAAKPKSLLLKSIPDGDVKKVFKAYFNKDDGSQKSKGNKGTPESKKGSSVKEAKSLKSKTQSLVGANNLINFEPFIEQPSTTPKQPSFTTKSSIPITAPPEISDKEKYLLVYTSLCSAIDALVDTIEISDENETVSGETLEEVKKCMPVNKVETILEVQSVPSESSVADTGSLKSNSDSEYFNYLKKVHWEQNAGMQKYFIDQNKGLTRKASTVTVEEDLETRIKESLINVFSLEDFKRKEEPYCLKEKAAQTDETYPNVFASQQGSYESIKSQELSSESSRNIFYFLEDVESSAGLPISDLSGVLL